MSKKSQQLQVLDLELEEVCMYVVDKQYEITATQQLQTDDDVRALIRREGRKIVLTPLIF